MRLGLYQAHSPGGDCARGLAEVDAALGAARADGVDMLTMPEVFLPGYNCDVAAARAEAADAVAALPQLVAKHGVGLCIGVAEYGERTWNAAMAYGRDGGLLASFRKVQLWGAREAALYEPGDALTLFEFEGGKLGLLICYDVEFPEHTRALGRAGAEAILVPTANMAPHLNVNEVTVPARALESGVTIVYANYCGEEGDLRYTGASLIVGPDGRIQARCGDEPELISADLLERDDPALETPASSQFEDFRPIETIQRGVRSQG